MLNHEIYDRKLAYANSKLANILFTYELSRRIKKTHIVANAVNPGGAATMIGINNGLLSWLRHIIYFLLKRKLLSPHKAAETIVFLATSSNLKCVTGKYYFQKVATKSSYISYNVEISIDLWRLSVQMTGIQAYREYFDDIIELN